MILFLPPNKARPRKVLASATADLHRHRAQSHFPKAEDPQGGPKLEPTSSRGALPIPRHHCPLGEVAQV